MKATVINLDAQATELIQNGAQAALAHGTVEHSEGDYELWVEVWAGLWTRYTFIDCGNRDDSFVTFDYSEARAVEGRLQ